MKKLLMLVFITAFLQASSLLKYNIDDLNGTINISMKLDSVFNGAIKEVESNDSKLAIMVDNLSVNNDIIKNNERIEFHPVTNGTIIKIPAQKDVKISALKSADGYELKIEIKPNNNLSQAIMTNPVEYRPDTTGVGWQYFAVIGFLIILLIVAFLVSKKQNILSKFFKPEKTYFKIIYQKAIDPKNRIVLIEFEGVRYLTLMGNSNVLLDKFSDKSNFEDYLNDEQINSYLDGDKIFDYQKKGRESDKR